MLRSAIFGLLYALVIALVLAVVIGLALYATRLSESLLPVLSGLVVAIAVFCGGLKAARLSGSRGLWLGILVGLLFFLVVAAVGWTGVPLALGGAGKKLGICLLGGVMGGIAGIASQ